MNYFPPKDIFWAIILWCGENCGKSVKTEGRKLANDAITDGSESNQGRAFRILYGEKKIDPLVRFHILMTYHSRINTGHKTTQSFQGSPSTRAAGWHGRASSRDLTGGSTQTCTVTRDRQALPRILRRLPPLRRNPRIRSRRCHFLSSSRLFHK
jgi:hypothetical protein